MKKIKPYLVLIWIVASSAASLRLMVKPPYTQCTFHYLEAMGRDPAKNDFRDKFLAANQGGHRWTVRFKEGQNKTPPLPGWIGKGENCTINIIFNRLCYNQPLIKSFTPLQYKTSAVFVALVPTGTSCTDNFSATISAPYIVLMLTRNRNLFDSKILTSPFVHPKVIPLKTCNEIILSKLLSEWEQYNKHFHKSTIYINNLNSQVCDPFIIFF
jgi:hypothetical protein